MIFPSGSCVLLVNLIKEKSGSCLVLLHQDRRKMMRDLSPIGKVDTMLLESLINSRVGGILLRGNLVGVNSPPFGLLMILPPLYVLLILLFSIQPIFCFSWFSHVVHVLDLKVFFFVLFMIVCYVLCRFISSNLVDLFV